jgi:hypothetical protein
LLIYTGKWVNYSEGQSEENLSETGINYIEPNGEENIITLWKPGAQDTTTTTTTMEENHPSPVLRF